MVRFVSHSVAMAGIALPLLIGITTIVSAQSNLPSCPADQNQVYDNCYGSTVAENGDKYVGEFRNNKKDGIGIYNFANGGKYFGEFGDDEISGRGTYILNSGDTYVGEFKENKANGWGTFTFKSGDKYSGDIKNWQFNGRIIVSYANGDSYSGFYENDKRKGDGVYRWKDGAQYEGRWEDGLPTQEGFLKNSQGVLLFGAQFTNAATYDSDGFITSPDILTFSGGDVRKSLEVTPNMVAELEAGDHSVEIYDDFSWRYSRKDCSIVIPSKLFFCGQDDTWRLQAEKTNEDAAAQYMHDDRNMALLIYEKAGSSDGMDAKFLRSAILDNMIEEAKKSNASAKIIEDGEVMIWGKEKANRIVASGKYNGVKIVQANTFVNRENETLQIVTISIGDTYTEAARKLHEDFLKKSALD